MANIKSAMKRAKITRVKNLRNRMVRSSVRTALKRFDVAVSTGDAAALHSKTVSKVDKAVAKGVLHKNAANRKKAQLARKIASV